MWKVLFVMVVSFVFSGCVSQESVRKQTVSGKAEAVYPGKTKEQVKDALVNYCNNKGMNVFESTDSLVICGKEVDSVMDKILVGNAYSKIRFTIALVNNSPKVWSDMWLESKAVGGEIYHMLGTSNTDRNNMQKILDNLKP